VSRGVGGTPRGRHAQILKFCADEVLTKDPSDLAEVSELLLSIGHTIAAPAEEPPAPRPATSPQGYYMVGSPRNPFSVSGSIAGSSSSPMPSEALEAAVSMGSEQHYKLRIRRMQSEAMDLRGRFAAERLATHALQAKCQLMDEYEAELQMQLRLGDEQASEVEHLRSEAAQQEEEAARLLAVEKQLVRATLRRCLFDLSPKPFSSPDNKVATWPWCSRAGANGRGRRAR
jgi:hypothetical protein